MALSASPTGSFVLAWMDEQAGNHDIYAQAVTSEGFLYGDNLILNNDDRGTNQDLPPIVTSVDGGFVVVWEDWRRGNSDIFMRRFDQNAQPRGDDYMVNDTTDRTYHGNPNVACDSWGNLVVVWEHARESLLNIYAQLFDSSVELMTCVTCFSPADLGLSSVGIEVGNCSNRVKFLFDNSCQMCNL